MVIPARRSRALGMRHGSAPMPLMPERGGEAPGRVDGEHQDALVLGGSDGHAQCRAHRGLADAAAAAADHHVERRQQASRARQPPCERSCAARGRGRSPRRSCQPDAERVGDCSSRGQPGPIDDERNRDDRHRELAPKLAHVARGRVVQVRLEVEAASSGAGDPPRCLRTAPPRCRVDQRVAEPAVCGGHRLVDRTIQHADVDGDTRSLAQPLVQLDRLGRPASPQEARTAPRWCGANPGSGRRSTRPALG